jgi:hypothetical protein
MPSPDDPETKIRELPQLRHVRRLQPNSVWQAGATEETNSIAE